MQYEVCPADPGGQGAGLQYPVCHTHPANFVPQAHFFNFVHVNFVKVGVWTRHGPPSHL